MDSHNFSTFSQLLTNPHVIQLEKKKDSVSVYEDIGRVVDEKKVKASSGHVIGYINFDYETDIKKPKESKSANTYNSNNNSNKVNKDSSTDSTLGWNRLLTSLVNITDDELQAFDRNSGRFHFVKVETELGFIGYASTYNNDSEAENSYKLDWTPIAFSRKVAESLLIKVVEDIEANNPHLLHTDMVKNVRLIEVIVSRRYSTTNN